MARSEDTPAGSPRVAPGLQAVNDPGDPLGAGAGERVVRGSFARIAAFGATNVFVAVSAVFLLRYLGVADFGRFGTVMALVAIVQGVSDAGLTITGLRELTLVEPSRRPKMLSHFLSIRLGLSALGAAAAVLFAVVAGYDSDLVLGTALAGVAVLITAVQATILLPLAVDLRNGVIAVNELLRQFFSLTCIVVLVLLGASLVGFFAAQVVAAAALLAVTPLLVGRHAIVRPRWDPEEVRRIARVGVPIAAAAIIGVVYFRVLTVLMSLVGSPDQTGYFVTSARIFELVAALPALLAAISLPVATVAARDDFERLVLVLNRTTRTMVVFGVLATVGVVLLAPSLILLLGGSQYEPAIAVLQIQAFALITLFTMAAWTPTILALNRQVALALAGIAGLIAVVVLGLVLIPSLEAKGAAIAAVAADALLLVATRIVLYRAAPGYRSELRFIPRLVIAAAISLAVLWLPIPDAVGGILGLALLCVLVLAFRLVPEEVLAPVSGFLRGVRRPRGTTGAPG